MDDGLRYADSIRGSAASPLHRRLFGEGPLDGREYRAFFEAHVKSVIGENIVTGTCHGATACNAGDGVLRLSDEFGSPAIPEVARLSLLLHEARHSDGYSHVRCPAGTGSSHYFHVPLEGSRECDSEALGPSGVQIVALRNIQRYCETCKTTDREEAGRYADSLLALIVSPAERQTLIEDLR